MLEILIATSNPGKFNEISEMLSDLSVKLKSLKDFNFDYGNPVESGQSYKENAFIKAKYFFDKVGIPCLGEDSGIQVDAFRHELGVKTRRWGAGEDASDEEWIEYFLKKMRDVPHAERGAHFICNSCFLDNNVEEYFEGETSGFITNDLQAPVREGIPLSSCFKPCGMPRVYASLNDTEKNKISHRGKAMREFRNFIIDFYKL